MSRVKHTTVHQQSDKTRSKNGFHVTRNNIVKRSKERA